MESFKCVMFAEVLIYHRLGAFNIVMGYHKVSQNVLVKKMKMSFMID
jgi:hypothetical protein